jgi:catechol 2,3-dioxygenase-like lactoylglutathione lyase family enzyme
MASPISTRVGQVFIPVRDMPASVRWYAALLGFEPDPARLGHEDTIYDLPTHGEPRLCLDANRPDFVASGPPRFFLWTDDLAAAVGHLGTVGAAAVSDVVDVGSLAFVTFEDPDGNLLMVAEPAGTHAT